MLEVLFNVFLGVASIFMLVSAVNVGLGLYQYYQYYKTRNEEEEIAESYVAPVGKAPRQTYDVDGFTNRMSEMRKEMYDGVPLYDVPPAIEPRYDEPGVEIITPSQEKRLDERFGR